MIFYLHYIDLNCPDLPPLSPLFFKCSLVFCRYGVVLKELSLYSEAIEILLKAVEMEPLHWGGWEELASICKNRETVS